jgi:NADH:ubiquinone oxidoreductase subunit 4 (subunit M)
VEAPTRGSIILARILLKIGGVGFVWILNYCFCDYSLLFFCAALLGRVIASLTCRFQRDIKALIAYRRVAHINYSTVVIMLMRSRADSCRSLLILRHSLVSGVLFIVAGTCFHFLRRRVVYFLKRSFLIKEIFMVVFMLRVFRNFAIPPSLRMIGEVFSFIFALRRWWFMGVFLCLYFVFVSYYSLFLMVSFINKQGAFYFGDSYTITVFVVRLSLMDLVFLSFY